MAELAGQSPGEGVLSRLRKGLDYDGKQPDLIRTVHGQGYTIDTPRAERMRSA